MGRTADVEAELVALRRAVYARDAPPEAAAAYTAALVGTGRAAAGPSEPPTGSGAVDAPEPVEPPRRHHRRVAMGVVSGVAVTLVLGTVLLGRAAAPGPAEAGSPTATTIAAAPSTTPLPEILPPPVPGPVLATFTSTSGKLNSQLDAGHRHVLLTAKCGGDGIVTIRLSDGSGTLLTCEAGLDGLAMALSDKPLGRFTVTATTTGRPIWAMTVGVVLTGAE